MAHLRSMIDGITDAVPFDSDVASRVGYIETFQDEFGNRRASDRGFLAHLFDVTVSPVRQHDAMGLDERLWWCLAQGEPIPTGIIGASDGLLEDPDSYAIEYRTMIELCALQAFWSLAIRDRDPALVGRAIEAARWHIDELQPDNAINRPWGLPVFVELAIRERDQTTSQTAELHAQTLLHNACINFGKPDLLSALILKDAIRLLEHADQCADF